MDNQHHLDDVRALATTVRASANEHETRIVTLLISAHGAALAVEFGAIVTGKVCSFETAIIIAAAFLVGAGFAFWALRVAYIASRDQGRFLNEWVQAHRLGVTGDPIGLLERIEKLDKIGLSMKKAERQSRFFTEYLYVSAILWFAGVVVAMWRAFSSYEYC